MPVRPRISRRVSGQGENGFMETPPVQSYRDADDGAMRRNLLSFDVQKLARIKQDVTQPGQRPVIGIFRRNIGRSVAR